MGKIIELLEYIPDWVWCALGGLLGLSLFALLMMLGEYLNNLN